MKRRFASAALTACLVLACWPLPVFPHAPTTTTVQFDREIVHVLDNHCVMCHVEKGLAFPLVTYEQTYAARWQIRQDALDRHMAPWAAVPGYGDFANDNGLTQRETDFLVSWAESYGPRNNGEVSTGIATPTASKPIQARTDFEGWAFGKPDLLLPIPANTLEPRQAEQIKRTIVDPKLKSDRWLRGLEYKPGDRRVVHAVSFAIQESGQWIGSWTPWHGVVRFPEGLAVRLPAGSHIVTEIHYYGSKEPVVDQGSLGLYYASQPSLRVVSNLVLEPTSGSGASGSLRKATTKLAGDMNILALQPAIRPGVQSVEVSARLPDGATQILLFAKDIPLDWPTPYVYRTPVSLPKDTVLSVIEHCAGEASAAVAGAPVTFSVYQGSHLPGLQDILEEKGESP